jgi:hypothetical protein
MTHTVETTETTDHCATEAAPQHRYSARRFVLHYLEMVVAMAVGMVALHPVWNLLLEAAGWTWLMHEPITGALIMATNMTVAMSAWMKFRGHGWRPIAEMGAAMYLPFVVLFVPMELGLITADAMYLWGHVLMLVAMAGAMALRPSEYAHC